MEMPSSSLRTAFGPGKPWNSWRVRASMSFRWSVTSSSIEVNVILLTSRTWRPNTRVAGSVPSPPAIHCGAQFFAVLKGNAKDRCLSGPVAFEKGRPAGPRRSTVVGGCLGNRKEEGRATRRSALDPDATAVRLDDAFRDWQPEPSALASCPCGLPKSVKDMGQVLGSDARARIRNSEDDLVIPRGRADRDTTASLRELDRVADQVLEHLKEAVPITPDLG